MAVVRWSWHGQAPCFRRTLGGGEAAAAAGAADAKGWPTSWRRGATSAGSAPRWTAGLLRQKEAQTRGKVRPIKASLARNAAFLPTPRTTPHGLTPGPADRHDSKLTEATLDAVPPISGGCRGMLRRRSRKPHADKAGLDALHDKPCASAAPRRASPATGSTAANASNAIAGSSSAPSRELPASKA